MKLFRALILVTIAAMVIFLPRAAYALDVTINAGDTVHFVNSMLPPHNIIVEGRADLSRESLMFSPGESQDILFADAGDYTFFCGPHQGAGMTGTIHVN